MRSLSIHLNCYKKITFSSPNIRMIGENVNFGDKKIKKWLLQKQKSSQDKWNWC